MSLPARTASARADTFRSACATKDLKSPLCNHGAPQHPAPSARGHPPPLRPYTLTRSFPTPGVWYFDTEAGGADPAKAHPQAGADFPAPRVRYQDPAAADAP